MEPIINSSGADDTTCERVMNVHINKAVNNNFYSARLYLLIRLLLTNASFVGNFYGF